MGSYYGCKSEHAHTAICMYMCVIRRPPNNVLHHTSSSPQECELPLGRTNLLSTVEPLTKDKDIRTVALSKLYIGLYTMYVPELLYVTNCREHCTVGSKHTVSCL